MRCRLTLVSIVSMCVDRVESMSEGGLTREMRVLRQSMLACRVLECRSCRSVSSMSSQRDAPDTIELPDTSTLTL